MAKTIQVRVDDHIKEATDMLFASLGLDTSTAIRMFLIASMQTGGIPFAILQNTERDETIREAIAYRKAGGNFLSAEESLSNMREAIKRGAIHEI